MNETTVTFAELTKSGVISVTDGYRAKNSELGGDGLIFLRAGHVTDTHIDFAGVERFVEKLTPKLQDKTSRVGDVIITTKGNSTGRTSFVDGTMPIFVYSPHLSRWRVEDKTKIDPGFLRYWCRSPQFVNQMRGLAASTDMAPYLSLRDQQRLEITLPHIDEQRGIGDVLSSLDDKIEQNRGTGAKLEGLARAVFKAWFVDFEPVKAKAAGATAFPGMPPETFAALPTRLTDSPLGPVPQGWEQATLRELAEFITGGTPSKKESAYWGGEFPWVSAKDMHGRIVSDSELRLTDAGRDSVRRLAPRHATLMVIRGMSLMTEVRIGWCTREVAFNQDLRGFIARDGIPPEFIHLWLTSSEEQLMQMVDTASHGTGRILTDRLDSMTIARSSDAVIRAFAEVSRPIMALRETLHAESAKLATLRDYLLPRLLSGRVRVAGVDDRLPAAEIAS